jgi:hypothetical protein
MALVNLAVSVPIGTTPVLQAAGRSNVSVVCKRSMVLACESSTTLKVAQMTQVVVAVAMGCEQGSAFMFH